MSYSELELQNRFAWSGGVNIFYRNADLSALPDDIPPLMQFGSCLAGLHDLFVDLAKPRLLELYEVRAPQAKHNFQLETPMKKLNDYLTFYKTHKCDNNMGAYIYALNNTIWGKECFGELEKILMKKVGIKYVDIVIDRFEKKSKDDPKGTKRKRLPPGPPTQRRRSGNVRVIIVRCCNTFIKSKFLDVGRTHHCEIILARKPKVGVTYDGISEIVKVTTVSHGYNGYLAICKGHWSIKPDRVIKTVMDKETGMHIRFHPAVLVFGDLTIFSFCAAETIVAWLKKQRPDMTAGEMIGVLTGAKKQQQPSRKAVVSDSDSDVSSPFTETSLNR